MINQGNTENLIESMKEDQLKTQQISPEAKHDNFFNNEDIIDVKDVKLEIPKENNNKDTNTKQPKNDKTDKTDKIVINQKYNNVDVTTSQPTEVIIIPEATIEVDNAIKTNNFNENQEVTSFDIQSNNFTESIIQKEDSGFNLESQSLANFLSPEQSMVSNLIVKDIDNSVMNLNDSKYVINSNRDNFASKHIVPEDLTKTLNTMNNNLEASINQFDTFFKRTNFSHVNFYFLF